MSLLAPAGLLALLAIPAILLLYFLKVRRPERRVATLMFWRPFVADRQANAPWQRLRPSLLLALQLLAALAIALALVRPGVSGAVGVGGTTAVILDGSASMQATDVSPSRFAAAVERARVLAHQLGPGQEMAVIELAQHALLLAPPSGDPAVLDAALDRAAPTGGAVDLGEGISLADAVVAGRPGATILLLSDGHAVPPPTPPRVTARFFYESIGGAGENTAVESIARTSPSAVFVRVANYGRQDRDLKVEMLADGRLADVLPVHVAANSTSDVTWNGLEAGTQSVEALITPGDALAIDDAGYLVTGAPPARRVLLVTDENTFLQRALQLRPGVTLTVEKKGAYRPAAAYDLYVFDGWVPPGPLPTPALVIDPVDGGGPVTLGAPQTPGPVLPPDPTDPITQDLTLKDVHVQVAARAAVPAGWRASISSLAGPLLLVHEGEPRMAELTFDIHHSDLPLRAAFPILVQNLLGYLLPGGFEDQSYPTGRAVTLAAEPGATAVTVTTPAGSTVRVGPPFPPAPFTATQAPGVYTVRQQLPSGVRVSSFVVQFQDPDLSRIAAGAQPFVDLAASAAGSAPRGTLELWPWLAVLAAGLLTVEWVVFHRGP